MLLVGKPEGNKPLRRSRRMWMDNIKMDLGDIDGMLWTGLVGLNIRTSGELL
jgi:hypothetical protein